MAGIKHYVQWLEEADQIVLRVTGFYYTDLPDWYWMDAYMKDMSPKKAAARFIEYLVDDGVLPEHMAEEVNK